LRLQAKELRDRASRLDRLGDPCRLCPRACGSRRGAGELGACGATLEVEVASYGPHHGEESVLVGRRGSGTIFFSHCNLRCIFCQNYDISHLGRGRPTTPDDLAGMMLELASLGCANINLVTPTHYAAGIVAALALAADRDLALPIVYNCGGYESVEVLRLLDGVVDVYMPDAKFADPVAAARLSGAPDYPEVMLAALREMQRQVGDLAVGDDGLATSGLLVRHLVMPGNLAASDAVLERLASQVSSRLSVNVMSQYRPCFRAVGAEGPVGRAVTRQEHREAVRLARELGLRIVP